MIDLNVSFEGSLSEEAAFYLGKKYHIALGIDFPKSLSLNEKDLTRSAYLEKVKFNLAFMQNPEALELCAYSLVKKLDKLGYVYAEVRLTPLLHTEEGLTQRQILNCVLRGLYKGLDEFPDINIKLIICMKRSATIALNRHTVELAIEYKNDVVVGVDLVGEEIERELKAFKPLYDLAKENGLRTCTRPDKNEIATAIVMGIERINLPCPILVNPDLLRTIQNYHFIFEVAPAHMLLRGVIKDYSELPNRGFLNYGIPFVITTPAMTLLNITQDKECRKLVKEFGYTYPDIRTAMNFAIMHSFASLQEKGELIQKLSSRFDYFYSSLLEE